MTNNVDADVADEKAKAIGKEIGVDELVDHDFDIVEESDDAGDEKLDKEAQRAEREDSTEKKERAKLSNQEKRALRKKKLGDKFSEKDAIIRAQQEQIDRLAKRQAEIDGRLHGINKAEVEKAYSDTQMAFQMAEKDHADAFNEGDGAKATLAMRAMYDAQRKLEQLQNLYKEIEHAPSVESEDRVSNKPDKAVASKAKAWAERNSDWYDPNGGDTDSEIAKTISGVLAKEGYDASTDDFWDELDDRLSKYVKKDNSSEDDSDDDVASKPKKRGGPPVSGGSPRADVQGKKTIRLPTSFINTLKANGIWDDIPRRNKIIADRERILREARA